MSKKNKSIEQYFGPCCSWSSDGIAPTGEVWKDIALKRERNKRESIERLGYKNPSLEMIFSKGREYVMKNERVVELVFYTPSGGAIKKRIINGIIPLKIK